MLGIMLGIELRTAWVRLVSRLCADPQAPEPGLSTQPKHGSCYEVLALMSVTAFFMLLVPRKLSTTCGFSGPPQPSRACRRGHNGGEASRQLRVTYL